MKTRIHCFLLVLCWLLTGCFDWTVPAGANLICEVSQSDTANPDSTGCPEGWSCVDGYCSAVSCGNGEIDPGEECDNAAANNDDLTGPSVCRTNCRKPYCGDGVIDEGEACDDQTDGDDNDGCSDICHRIGRCGDGVIQEAVESCEDGNRTNGDGCSSDCISEDGFVLLSRGVVTMGSEEVTGAWPPREVVLSREFFMMEHEVTQRDWLEGVGDFRGTGPENKDCLDCPIENVSWFDALAYCNEKSRQAGMRPCYGLEPALELFGEATITFPRGLSCTGYRLPTEAEWEYAVRANSVDGSERFYDGTGVVDTPHPGNDPGCFANADLESIGWYCGNSGDGERSGPASEWKIQLVMQLEPNHWGLYDMLGNVSEWVWDSWQPYDADGDGLVDQVEETGPAMGSDRVKRGGAYFESAEKCTMAGRQPHSPNDRDNTLGFRVVRTVRAW